LKKIDFSKYSSIKIGPQLDVKLIDEIDDYSQYYIIGGANNLLVSPNSKPLALLSKEFDYIKLDDNILTIGAATKSGRVYSFCKKNNITGLEFLSNLPGTMGGIIKMNAGLKEYEIFNSLISIKTNDGIIKKDNIKFSYRKTDITNIIFEIKLKVDFGFDNNLVELFDNMRKNQPKSPSFGSCFKNPSGDFAGRLIDEVGLKGFQIGEVAFSTVHANFLVNLGHASFDDAITLINLAKDKVYSKYDILLEEEVIIL
jgi:UDP-N-acetylmuramate dehydrogenase